MVSIFFSRNRGDELEFVTIAPPDLCFEVDLNKNVIHQTLLQVGTDKVRDNRKITSLLDLYGAKLIITLPHVSPTVARITKCTLFFPFGTANGKVIGLKFDDSERQKKTDQDVVYVKVLSEKELGPKPEILK